MTQEEKIKAYDEALEKIQPLYKQAKKEDNPIWSIYEHIFPELRESEDERIRKALLGFFGEQCDMSDVNGVYAYEVVEWLEKQKEKTENARKILAKILKHSAEGFRRILKKKGIDHEVSDEFWENTAGAYSKEEDVKFRKWMDDLMGPTPIEETHEYKKGLEAGMKQKEQKPIVLSDKFEIALEEFLMNARDVSEKTFAEDVKEYADRLREIVMKEQKPAEKQDYSGLNDLERAIHRGFLSAGIENVPVGIIKETAQECLARMKPAECIEDSVKFEEGFKTGRETGLRDGKKYVLDNAESYGLCKPAEWSEEDEMLMDELESYILYDKEFNDEQKSWRIKRLKSIRPSWKPSEEQMCELNWASKLSPVLESLYEQLKKL